MAVKVYKPFEHLNFSKQFCFLSGEKLLTAEEQITVFPLWLLQEYELQDKPFKLLDESMSTYSDMKLPCSGKIYEQAIEPFIIPWALYNWVPDLFEQMEQDREEKNIQDKTISLACSQQNELNLTPSEAELFNNLNTTYFSYYKVKAIEHDGSIILIDLLFGK
jgi:hypothetical protein